MRLFGKPLLCCLTTTSGNHYDAEGEDAATEEIVQEILARGHFEMKR